MPNQFSRPLQQEYIPQYTPLPFEAIGNAGRLMQARQDEGIEMQSALRRTMASASVDPVNRDLFQNVVGKYEERLSKLSEDGSLYADRGRLRALASEFAAEYRPFEANAAAYNQSVEQLRGLEGLTQSDRQRRMAAIQANARLSVGEDGRVDPASMFSGMQWADRADMFSLMDDAVAGIEADFSQGGWTLDSSGRFLVSAENERVPVERIQNVALAAMRSNPEAMGWLEDEYRLAREENPNLNFDEFSKAMASDSLSGVINKRGKNNVKLSTRANPDYINKYQRIRLQREQEQIQRELGTQTDENGNPTPGFRVNAAPSTNILSDIASSMKAAERNGDTARVEELEIEKGRLFKEWARDQGISDGMVRRMNAYLEDSEEARDTGFMLSGSGGPGIPVYMLNEDMDEGDADKRKKLNETYPDRKFLQKIKADFERAMEEGIAGGRTMYSPEDPTSKSFKRFQEFVEQSAPHMYEGMEDPETAARIQEALANGKAIGFSRNNITKQREIEVIWTDNEGLRQSMLLRPKEAYGRDMMDGLIQETGQGSSLFSRQRALDSISIGREWTNLDSSGKQIRNSEEGYEVGKDGESLTGNLAVRRLQANQSKLEAREVTRERDKIINHVVNMVPELSFDEVVNYLTDSSRLTADQGARVEEALSMPIKFESNTDALEMAIINYGD